MKFVVYIDHVTIAEEKEELIRLAVGIISSHVNGYLYSTVISDW